MNRETLAVSLVCGTCIGSGLALALVYVAAGGPWWVYLLGAALVLAGTAFAILGALRGPRPGPLR
jgi:hypothetical protein